MFPAQNPLSQGILRESLPLRGGGCGGGGVSILGVALQGMVSMSLECQLDPLGTRWERLQESRSKERGRRLGQRTFSDHNLALTLIKRK